MSQSQRNAQRRTDPAQRPSPNSRRHHTPRRSDSAVLPPASTKRRPPAPSKPQGFMLSASRLAMYAFFGVLLFLICTHVVAASQAWQGNQQIADMEAAISSRRGENENLVVRINTQQNNRRVQDGAARLGMVPAEDWQIRVFSFNNRSVQGSTDTNEQLVMSTKLVD